MVRIGVLPMRLLCLKYGADYVYAEEIIDHKMINCRRVENHALNTIDFISDDDQHPIFQTCSAEKHAVVFQIGTCDPERALAAAKIVEDDVAAVDINMGCPKAFSLHGGMGAALLEQPEKVEKILKTLVQGLKVPVTCKIRVLPDLGETIKLVKLIESCGVKAIAVHGRTKQERPQHQNRNHFIREITQALKIPVIANGGSKEIKQFEDIATFLQNTQANSVMLARVAMLNPSIFLKTGKLELASVIDEYLKLAAEYDSNPAMVKYTMQIFLQYALHTTERGLQLLEAKSLREICKIWNLTDHYTQCLTEQRDRLMTYQNRMINREDENSIDNDDDVIVLPLEFIRKHYCSTILMPKMILYDYARNNSMQPPSYVTRRIGKLFLSEVKVEKQRYASTFRAQNKKGAEQAAALAALVVLDECKDLPELVLESISWPDVKLILNSAKRKLSCINDQSTVI